MENEFDEFKDEEYISVGGLVDKFNVSIMITGNELDPDKITRILKVTPTEAHRKGEKRSKSIQPIGVWILSVEGKSPKTPEEFIMNLFARLPDDPAIWAKIGKEHELTVSLRLFLNAWNRGLEISSALIRKIADFGFNINFDIYANIKNEES